MIFVFWRVFVNMTWHEKPRTSTQHSSGLDVLPVNRESTLLMRGLKPFCEFQHEYKLLLSNVE